MPWAKRAFRKICSKTGGEAPSAGLTAILTVFLVLAEKLRYFRPKSTITKTNKQTNKQKLFWLVRIFVIILDFGLGISETLSSSNVLKAVQSSETKKNEEHWLLKLSRIFWPIKTTFVCLFVFVYLSTILIGYFGIRISWMDLVSRSIIFKNPNNVIKLKVLAYNGSNIFLIEILLVSLYFSSIFLLSREMQLNEINQALSHGLRTHDG